MTLEQLNNVNDGPAASYVEPRVLVYDINNNEWVASTTLDEISGISFLGQGGDVIEEFCLDMDQAISEDSAVPSVQAVKDWVNARPKPNLEELDDCGDLSGVADGEVPTWDAANGKWIPTKPAGDRYSPVQRHLQCWQQERQHLHPTHYPQRRGHLG